MMAPGAHRLCRWRSPAMLITLPGALLILLILLISRLRRSSSITPRPRVNHRLPLCSKGEKPFNSDSCITNFMDLDGPAEAGSVR